MHFTLQQLGLLDAPPEDEYDNLTSLAAQLLQVPTAHVSILDHENKRIFYKSQHGHPTELAEARQLPMELTYCQHVALTQEPVIVVDAREHPLMKNLEVEKNSMPLAYLGMPISAPGGQIVGGLCMMQPDSRHWSESELVSAKKMAACISDLIRLKAAMLTSEQLRREQSAFTYAISHDLKSPANTLHMILSEVDQERERLSDDVNMLVKEGLSTVQRMRLQVEDVLQYSRTVDNTENPSVPISLNALMLEILSELKRQIDEASASINIAELPDIHGNRLQVKALFHNLIGNALKYRAAQTAPVISMTAAYTESPRQHSIYIKDNGIGVAPEDQTSIFKLFSRLHLQEDYPGTGIGLALCHRVMENHHGSISIASDGKTGSTFTVNFPGHQS